jgi:hypothetical protein
MRIACTHMNGEGWADPDPGCTVGWDPNRRASLDYSFSCLVQPIGEGFETLERQ